MKNILFLIIFGIIFSSIIGFIQYNKKILIKEETIILLKKNEGLRNFSRKLKEEKIIKSSTLFLLFSKVVLGNKYTFGEYLIQPSDTIFSIINKIKNRRFYYRKITFIEGETVFNYREKILKSYGLFGEITQEMKEGYLLPQTYMYKYGDSRDNIIKQMTTSMNAVLNSRNVKNINYILTLASIVEKETSLDSERYMVASVFINRLQKKMKLQSDPTVIYQISNTGKLGRELTKKDILQNGLYNTYQINGLPIGPIGNPSLKSIEAVLNPIKTDMLYFVAKDCSGKNGHNFAKDYKEHIKNVKLYKQSCKL